MKQQDITLRITVADDESDPQEWNYTTLLDLKPGESVRMMNASDVAWVPDDERSDEP